MVNHAALAGLPRSCHRHGRINQSVARLARGAGMSPDPHRARRRLLRSRAASGTSVCCSNSGPAAATALRPTQPFPAVNSTPASTPDTHRPTHAWEDNGRPSASIPAGNITPRKETRRSCPCRVSGNGRKLTPSHLCQPYTCLAYAAQIFMTSGVRHLANVCVNQ